MKKKALRKDLLVEIKSTFNRYLSLILIVALGVAFFSGIRATSPDMKLTLDRYLDRTNLMDIRVVSTLGLTEDDLKHIEQIEGVNSVEGSYTYDAYMVNQGDQQTIHFISMPEKMNHMEVVEGRMIENDTECIIDSVLAYNRGYQIGETITLISGKEDEDVGDILEKSAFTIVGFATSPVYFTVSRDTTDIGNGATDGFIYLDKDVFKKDVYSAIYVLAEGAKSEVAYSEKYENTVKAVIDQIKVISEEREQTRYDNIMSDGKKAIDDAQKELDDAKIEVAEELDLAWSKIIEGEEEITEGEQELADNKVFYHSQMNEADALLAQKEKEIKTNEQLVSQNEIQLEQAEKQILQAKKDLEEKEQALLKNEQQCQDGMSIILENETQLEQGMQAIDGGIAEIELRESQLNEQITEAYSQLSVLTAQKQQFILDIEMAKEAGDEEELQLLEQKLLGLEEDLVILQIKINELESSFHQIEEQKALLMEQKETVTTQREALLAEKEQLMQAIAQIESGKLQIEDGKKQLLMQEEEVSKAFSEIEQAKMLLADGKKQLDSGKKELKKEKAKAEEEFNRAAVKIADGKLEIADAKKEYEDGKIEAEKEFLDAEKEIADARQELADIDYPEWYVLDRLSLQNYVEYGQNAERINAIGRVFPVIFFLVAALMSLTTMTRMVEAQRTQIGTLKALGYGTWDIAGKYVWYALSASAIGSLIGIVFGQKFIPWVIITSYKIMYPHIGDVLIPINLKQSVIASVIAIACVTLAAFSACYRALTSSAAALMRPLAPKTGRKIFLEQIPFIWKRLKFTSKVTMRNLFRYKKRFFMTIFGIAGCTAMVVFGFGLTDSINGVASHQYEELLHYDLTISINEKMKDEEFQHLNQYLVSDDRIERYTFVRSKYITVDGEKSSYNAYLTVPENSETYEEFVIFQDRKTKELYSLDDEHVIITEKFADLLGVKVGDYITITDNEKDCKVQIGQIIENYIMSYIYMSPVLYEEIFDQAPLWNTVQVYIPHLTVEDEDALSLALMDLKGVAGVTTMRHTQEKFLEVLDNLDIITLILITAAGLLAFIVLYNLNNINITERRRELATIKVLGFYDKEVSSYVFRENIVLTIFGICAGLIMGKYLHAFIVTTVETDTLMFVREAEPSSYLYAVLLTIAFSLIVNLLMQHRLKKIDMVESLKSVE